MKTAEKILKSEFDGEDGSFLLIARCELRWDKVAFRHMTNAMYDVAIKFKDKTKIDQWVANGFWFCDTWVREWTSHPDFPKPGKEYYEDSIELLHDLAYLLFVGDSPYEDDTLKMKAKG